LPTTRQQIVALLEECPTTVREIAGELGMRMVDVVDHLRHIQRSLGTRLSVGESECESCGLHIDRQRRFTAPSRCPKCRSERTSEPRLAVRKSDT
jgi:predicted Zn-ribbon and HTH transcriptional regulator